MTVETSGLISSRAVWLVSWTSVTRSLIPTRLNCVALVMEPPAMVELCTGTSSPVMMLASCPGATTRLGELRMRALPREFSSRMNESNFFPSSSKTRSATSSPCPTVAAPGVARSTAEFWRNVLAPVGAVKACFSSYSRSRVALTSTTRASTSNWFAGASSSWSTSSSDWISVDLSVTTIELRAGLAWMAPSGLSSTSTAARNVSVSAWRQG